MRSRSIPVPPIPSETFQAAHKVYNIQHVYLRLGDQLGDMLASFDLALLDASAAVDLNTLYRLALITVFQYAEALPDPAAAQATQKRMDWKYALYLPIKHPGIAASALCEFRQSLSGYPRGLHEFARLLERTRDLGLFSRRAALPLAPTALLNAVCETTRLDQVYQAMQAAISALGSDAPEWLRENAPPHWYARYHAGQPPSAPQASTRAPLKEARALGADIDQLWNSLRRHCPAGLSVQPEIQSLAQVLDEHYIRTAAGIQWRQPGCARCTSHRPRDLVC